MLMAFILTVHKQKNKTLFEKQLFPRHISNLPDPLANNTFVVTTNIIPHDTVTAN